MVESPSSLTQDLSTIQAQDSSASTRLFSKMLTTLASAKISQSRSMEKQAAR